MNKTNIRINNHFIIEENKEYYSSSMKDLDEWKGIGESELEEYKEEIERTQRRELAEVKSKIFADFISKI